MKKIAMVIGGSNGLGAAAVQKLISENYSKIYVVDKTNPILSDERITFVRFNLLSDEPESLLQYNDIDTLIITAGVGRLDYFQNLTKTEIDLMFKINTVSLVKIISAFYNKINSADDFYCTVI